MEMNDISHLAALLRENGDKVLNGQSKLSLSVGLLKNINGAFSLIVDNKDLCSRPSSFHVMNTDTAKDEIFTDIQFLHEFIQKTVGLKIINNAVTNEPFTYTLDICKFKSLKYLELRKVPVHLLNGLQSIRAQLQSIVCIRCIRELEELLLDCGADHSSGFVWSDLREAVFSYNNIDLLGRSLEFAPWLQILDLSHNRICNAEAIDCLPNLKYLNISYNLLESIPGFNKDACRKLQVLVIKNNYIEDLSGLLGLECLLELDLSCNCLSSHDVLSPLFWLPTLTWLSLEGNPLSFHPQHRTRTSRHLNGSAANGKFVLDHMPLSKSEKLVSGSIDSPAVPLKHFLKEDASSIGSSSASERTLVAERDGECVPKVQQSQGSKKSSRVREAVISEQTAVEKDESELSSSFMTSSIDLSTDHLETKKQIETLREKFGEENWLHSHAGSCVQDVLGLHKTPAPVLSPQHSNSLPTDEMDKTDNNHIQMAVTSETELVTEVQELARVLTVADNAKQASPEIEETEEEEEKDEEEEGEGEEQLYLVQRLRPGSQGADEFFLVVTERWLKEREVLCGKTLEKWTMESLLSCMRTGGQSPAVVQLTFDTVRRDRQERTYIMDEKDAQKLVRTLGDVLDAKPLTAMNQLAFRCMKCSTQFSQEVPHTGAGEKVWTCPTCNSTLVIQMDEVPLPSHHRESRDDKPDSGAPCSGFNTSPSQSSIGRSGIGEVNDTGVSAVTGVGDKLQVTAMIHQSEVHLPPSRSAASLDPFADAAAPVRRWDSDIEIISNPSQSSIEVLDEQGRLGTPSRKRSSEERQEVSIVVPHRHQEERGHFMTLTGLTESSSSGSLTDSICTTYEIHSSKQSGIAKKSEEREKMRNKKLNGAAANSSLEDNLELEESPSSLFKVHEEMLSPRANYANMLEGLLQSVGSKLFSKSPEKILESPDREIGAENERVKYCYTDFSVVDHRVKLHLYLQVFQEEQEDLLFLIRAHVISQSSKTSYPACVVVSTKKVYILQVTGDEGDDPEQWLHRVHCCPVETLTVVFPLPWKQGVGMELSLEGGEPSSFLIVLQDQEYTANFFSFLSGVALPKQCTVHCEALERHTLSLQQLLLSAATSDDADPTICLFAVPSSCRIQRNEETKEMGMCSIIITCTDVLLLYDNLEWMFLSSAVSPQLCSAQRMSNLIDVEMEGHCSLTVNFLDEAAGSDESWTLTFGTELCVKSILSAIRTPWERLFSVPLQITSNNVSVVSS